MKQTGRFGLWAPEDADAPDGPTALKQLAEGTESTDGLNDLLARAGAQSGKSSIATEQSTESSSFTLLGTPDRVPNVELLSDGLIYVTYRALWKGTLGEIYAALFLDETQLKMPSPKDAASAKHLRITATNFFTPLVSDPRGLMSAQGATKDSSYVGTGMILGLDNEPSSSVFLGGGVCVIEADAGTYDVSVRFKRSEGKLSAKERKLRVWTREFL